MYLIYRGVGDPSTDDPGSWKHCGDSMLWHTVPHLLRPDPRLSQRISDRSDPAYPSRPHWFFQVVMKTQSHRETDHFFFNLESSPYANRPWSVPRLSRGGSVIHFIWMGHPSHLNHTLTHHTRKHLTINLVIIFRCSSSPNNPVYVSRVDSSSLVFSLSSYRHSCICLNFRSRFIDS